MKTLGVLFPVCDGDKKHFERFGAELARLGYPFAVHFDHCSDETKQFFKSHPNFLEAFEDDDPRSFFGEDSRQSALNILVKHKFDWALTLDCDETLEKDAPAKIKEIIEIDADLVDCPLLDLWLDDKHYRIDVPFARSHREKFFNLKSGKWKYYHAAIHAPKLFPERETKVVKYPMHMIHWGIMNMDDVREHTVRWNKVYTQRLGNNPYGFYEYMNDPLTVPILRDFDYETWNSKNDDRL